MLSHLGFKTWAPPTPPHCRLESIRLNGQKVIFDEMFSNKDNLGLLAVLYMFPLRVIVMNLEQHAPWKQGLEIQLDHSQSNYFEGKFCILNVVHLLGFNKRTVEF